MAIFYVNRWHQYDGMPEFPAHGESMTEGPRHEWGNRLYYLLRDRPGAQMVSVLTNRDGISMSAGFEAETDEEARRIAHVEFTAAVTESGVADDFDVDSYEWDITKLTDATFVDATPTSG